MQIKKNFKEDQMLTVSLYARVSSEKQVQENTIASQLSALENKIKADGHELLDEHKFVDNGYSGSNLVRPALEKLRNKVAEGKIDIIYIHSPDRLSRKYAYQMVLLEELQKAKVEVIFLNNQINDSPEAHLLLQMQGMIAEYEHTKITERCRRGKIYAAKKGSVNVMCRAPYGYRYINKQMEGGQARFEVHEEEAEVVRKLFSWIGRERMSAGEVCRQLNTMSIMSAKGKCWNKGTLCGTLKNPVYKGQAAFGKTKVGAKLPQIRPYKHSCEQPKKNSSTYRVEREHWIYIPVPKIVDEDLFDIVQKQLAENAKRQRARQIGTTNLLQGLLVCKRCQYSYYAKRYGKSQKKCYRCIGADAYRFAGNKICNSKTIRASTLETAVWEEVKSLLKNPNRILKEYQRRLSELQKSPCDQITDSLKKQDDKLKQGISRLIDSYTQGYISKEEFEPRIKAAKQSLKIVEEEKKKIFNRKNLQQELTLVVTNLEEFFSNIKSKLDDLDWLTKRNVIRILVKRIEVDIEEVNIVFRVKDISHSTEHNNEKGQNLQHCRSSQYILHHLST
ncbi:recombinase family protein [Wolbachia endosymbiont of Cylisticus convexus]|uniref:recombinase family protein n=2 Tax=Wolbachia endosymbiont of Cylisticus convexus TaxID=118728 RepID=UPI001F244DC8|nr:recombinase family protein [Wolbachia endosymbiont of Cylisticus convexus]